MRRTWKQTAFVLMTWTLAAAACLGAWMAGYNLGWIHGYANKRAPTRVVAPSGALARHFAAEPPDDDRMFVDWVSQLMGGYREGGTVMISEPLPGKAS